MLKKRIIAVVPILDGIAVQSFEFKRYLPIGKPEVLVRHLNEWGADEIVVLNLSAHRAGIDHALVERVAAECRVPLAYGGGIASAQDMLALVQAGADKVILNQAFWNQPGLVSEGAALLGDQCVVVAIDTCEVAGGWRCYDYAQKKLRESDPSCATERAQSLGAGEILLNSVNRDGTRQGYDLKLLLDVSTKVHVPLLACGGVGHVDHLAEALGLDRVMGVCAANFFTHTEHSVAVAKSALSRAGIALRRDKYIDYREFQFDRDGRILKLEDPVLEEMLFQRHEREVL